MCRWRSKTENTEHMRDKLNLAECDLRGLLSVQHLVEKAAPDYIVHLAAQSLVASSWHTPANSASQVKRGGHPTSEGERSAVHRERSRQEYALVREDEVPNALQDEDIAAVEQGRLECSIVLVRELSARRP
jgi:dTDP-D-glucose 4,6-dehydratase